MALHIHDVRILHVHPRFSYDGKQILLSSDMSSYGNVCLIDTPNVDALPGLEELTRR